MTESQNAANESGVERWWSDRLWRGRLNSTKRRKLRRKVVQVELLSLRAAVGDNARALFHIERLEELLGRQ